MSTVAYIVRCKCTGSTGAQRVEVDYFANRDGYDFTTATQSYSGYFCQACRGSFKFSAIRGKRTATPCDGRCTHAKGGDCECSCAGKNHASGL